MVLRYLHLSVAIWICHAELITELPGYVSNNYKQYSGYLNVGNDHLLHYWFAESQRSPSTDPLILWLTGGPGCSSLSALLTENGPLTVQPDGKTVKENQYSWNRIANLIFLESPVDVGFSYSVNGFSPTDDDKVATENRLALIQFFREFPQFRNNDFYVIGESYGGMYVPTLVQEILDHQSEFYINIKGMAIGNGELSYELDINTLIQFAYAHGLVDETTWERVGRECCDENYVDCSFSSFSGYGFCSNFVQETVTNCWQMGVNPYNMFADCAPDQELLYHEAKFKLGITPSFKASSIPCLNVTPCTYFLNQPEVRRALFIPEQVKRWKICNDEIGETYQRKYSDVSSQIKNAVSMKVRVLIYNGDGDMACNFLMGQRFVQKLGYKLTSPKQWFEVDGQIGGYYTRYGDVEFIVVKGAGHMVPTDKPSVAFHILEAFLTNRQP